MKTTGLTLLLMAAALTARAGEDTHTLVVEDVVAAPPAEVWRLFTTAQGLETWMVPHAEIDLKVGGEMRTNYVPHEELGGPNTITNRILSYEPERMLSLKAVGYPEGFKFPEVLAGAWSVIYFDPAAGGATRLRLVGMGYPDTPEGREALKHFEAGNRWTLQQLKNHVGSGTGPTAPAVSMTRAPAPAATAPPAIAVVDEEDGQETGQAAEEPAPEQEDDVPHSFSDHYIPD